MQVKTLLNNINDTHSRNAMDFKTIRFNRYRISFIEIIKTIVANIKKNSEQKAKAEREKETNIKEYTVSLS